MLDYRITNFNKLYSDINACSKCVKAPGCNIVQDSARVRRITDKRALNSKIFLIGEALGEHTQRKSGRPYTFPNGALSPSGRNLDRFLRCFGYTMDSTNPNGYQYAYSSDIVQCYPGKRKPTIPEVTNCINQGFLLNEIGIIEPTLILLMGRTSRNSFFRNILEEPKFPSSLSEQLNEIIRKQKPFEYRFLNRDIYVIPIQHPSGANPEFNGMATNHKLIDLIRRCCND